MLFNSPEFIFLFLPLSFCLYFFSLKKKKVILSKVILILCSLFFYGYWNPVYLWLLLGSILFNYCVGTKIINSSSHRQSKLFLIAGIAANLSLLGYFKYSNFFIENFNYFSTHQISFQHIILPLGISFITFQKIAFLADCYQRKVTKKPDFLDYSLFVSFFPQLIAGPIVHHSSIIPQFKSLRSKILNYKNISLGIFIFIVGLFKKVVIADRLALYNLKGFQNPELLFPLEAWLTSFSYSFQIYFDFSGYTDMAIGTALLFNIQLPYNFNSPYKASNIQDFWKRWHMTLSEFLKDYVYIPLGGNKLGEFRSYLNLLLVFFVSGLWHGASWTFIFWGMLHGSAVCLNKLWNQFGLRMNKYVGILLTFLFVNFAWIFFRIENFGAATAMIHNMLFLDGFNASEINFKAISEILKFNKFEFVGLFLFTTSAYYLAPIVFSDAQKNSQNFKPNSKYLLILITLFSITCYNLYKPSTFIYFNF